MVTDGLIFTQQMYKLLTSELGLLYQSILARSSPVVVSRAYSNTSTFCIRTRWS